MMIKMLGYFRAKNMPGRKGLAFVLIAKNEAPYIAEWIGFHRKQGVSHFIIYDNESTDNFREVLSPYIDAGLVTYHAIRGKARQIDAYNMALHDYGHKFKYMGFIDADEFMFVRNSTNGGGGTKQSIRVR
ncbi:MAG: glycosyltransferase family 2 protein [Synergistaceae bacterium]|nr:glycosyltransferase family 2 protein [Synergistaceae bacterium]